MLGFRTKRRPTDSHGPPRNSIITDFVPQMEPAPVGARPPHSLAQRGFLVQCKGECVSRDGPVLSICCAAWLSHDRGREGGRTCEVSTVV